MNILYYTQMSMYNKQTKELTPAADGNINMMRNTINEWHKHRPDDIFYILLPYSKETTSFYYGFNKKENIKYLWYNNYVVSARINRFNFPMNEFIHLLKDIKINLIINDVIELTSNFQQMFNVEFGYKPKIISNIRHLDDVINHYYMHRVLDGIIQSDIVTILSDSMKSKLDNQIVILSGNHLSANKVISFEPSVSHTELELYRYKAIKKEIDKVIITFPGRLSKGEEKRTNYDKFIEAINKLRNKRQDFKVYFTDPNNAINPHYVDAQKWINTIPKSRPLFLDLLNKTDVIVSLMDVEGFGGISIREALLFNCLPIIPYAHEYKKMTSKGYLGYVKSPIEVDDLVGALDWAINYIKFEKNDGTYWIRKGKQFSVEEQFKKLLPRIEAILND